MNKHEFSCTVFCLSFMPEYADLLNIVYNELRNAQIYDNHYGSVKITFESEDDLIVFKLKHSHKFQ
jgi:hypothetical protein